MQLYKSPFTGIICPHCNKDLLCAIVYLDIPAIDDGFFEAALYSVKPHICLMHMAWKSTQNMLPCLRIEFMRVAHQPTSIVIQ